MQKEIKYNVSKLATSYSKKKGSFSKSFSLAKGLTKEQLDEYIKKYHSSIDWKTDEDGNMEGRQPGFLCPETIFVKKIGGSKSAKKLKFWSGRGHGFYNRKTLYVAAYSIAEATRLLKQVCKCGIPGNEIRDYYQEGWGGRENESKEISQSTVLTDDNSVFVKIF